MSSVGVGRVLHKHRMGALGSMGVSERRRRAAEDMGLWVIRRLCVDDARVEVRVVGVVCVQWRGAVGGCGRIYRDCVHGRNRTAACIWRRRSHAVSWCVVGRARHGAASDGRHRLGLVDCGLWIHVLWGSDVSQLGVVAGLGEVVGVGARVVADEVEVLSALSGDAEGLLHQTVGLVAVAIWSFAFRVACC